MESIGVSFTRDSYGNIDLRYFGGQDKQRTAYAGARTGKQLVTALINECRKWEVKGNIKRHVGWRFLSLILENDECHGVVCINEDTSEIKEFNADAVIIATGGLNNIFGKTSGSVQNDGVATARLFEQGVELANLEMIQYHPTTVRTSSKRMLITEAARGEGGKLYVLKDGEPWYFMKEWYPQKAELMPRDVVSRGIYKASDAGKNQVYLDISHLSDETVKIKLDEVYETCMKYLNLDPTRQPIPVFQGIHYFMGGIKTDENHRTNIKRLFAAGECSCQYHGANRLGGNSLLGAIHGGCIAALNALKLSEVKDSNYKYEIEYSDFDDGELFLDIESKIACIMNKAMSIFRSEEELEDALVKLDKLDSLKVDSRGNYYSYIKVKSLILLSKAMLISAISRKESRGAHQRVDFPETSEDYKKVTSAIYDGKISVSFKELVENE